MVVGGFRLFLVLVLTQLLRDREQTIAHHGCLFCKFTLR